ncbi:hypothetical protein [Hwangdonia sp.]|uniref:hypothetical protein n=1 Tax=Hwangdonia sp. TaxID=1883432 RepID=UPI003AB5E956
MEINKNKLLGFIAIGIFVYKITSNISYFLGDFTKDLFIYIGIPNLWNFWLSQIFELSLFLILVYFLVNYVLKKYNSINENVLKYFVWSFLIYFILQIFQIAFPSIKTLFEPDSFNEGFLSYHEFLKNSIDLYFVQSFFYYLGEVLAIIFIYNKIKNVSQQRTELKNKYY